MKRAAWIAAGALALLAVAVGALAWLATTANGFRWLAQAVAAASGDRLALEGVDGHFGAPITIGKLTFSDEYQRIEIEGVRLEWRPRALWQRRLDIDLLAAQTLRVTTLKRDPTPAALPVSLRAPLDVSIRTLDVATLAFVDAGQTLVLRALHAQLDGSGDRYRLAQAGVETPWATLHGEFELGKDAPFALRGGLDAERPAPLPVAAHLVLSGTLAAPVFRLDAEAEGMSVMAAGEAAPFDAVRLRRLLVAGQGVDPRLFVADAPAADFAFSGIFEGQPGERLLGSFSVSNRLAGRLDQQRLPLANLSGAVFGDTARADFSALAVDLGALGQFTGSGSWRDGRFAVDLHSPRVNLAGLHHDLYATNIRTTLALSGDAARQTLVADVAEAWGQGRFALTHGDAALTLEAADFSGQAGRLTASGRLQLDTTRAFALDFDAANLNPARFGTFPRGRLNARGTARGVLAPDLSVQAQFSLPPGELEGRPVSGQGRLHYEDHHLADADVDLDLAGNRATVKGAYGRVGDRLNWDVDAPALARLNLGLAGRLASRGSLAGAPARPQIEATASAGGLRLPGGIAADSLNLALDLQATADGAFNGRLEARGVALAGQTLQSVRASAQGRRNAHTLELDARLPEWHLSARLAGGLDAALTWRGHINQAAAQGPWPMRLEAPAALQVSRSRQQVDGLVLTLAGGRVTVDHFSHADARFASRGALADLPLAPLLALMPSPPPFTTDLRVDGDWDLAAGETLDGRARLARRSGDVRLVDPALNLGLATLTFDVDAAASRISARAAMTTREAGNVLGTARAALVRDGAFFMLPRSAPLDWTATADVPDLRILRPLIPIGVRADARLKAHLAGSGSLAAPRLDGEIDASRIRFSMPEEGVAIADGTLKLALAGDRVRVREGEFKGQSGRIRVSGEAQLKNPQAGLTLDFEQFAASNRSDRRVIVSGATRLELDPKRLQLSGRLRADRARLEIPEASRPALSDDVVVAGRPPRDRPLAQRLPLALDLNLELGDDFLFKGGGLDARLGGNLRVFTVARDLRGEGRIRVAEGRYAAYGQTLAIERGELRFVGPIDNPGLDVLAVRATPTVKAGVQVRGTVQRPLVTLYSEPPLPDSEKLAWLVLGHGLDRGGQQEFALLQLAAGALLSQAESVSMQAEIAETLRIDSFGVRGGEGEDLGTTVVSVGKRLSSHATLSYEQSLDGLSQVVKVLYQLTPRIRLEAQAGQQSSFDAFYSREYD
ncbi:MAG: translocation/assembly module TamB domain-containing protein [Gammaproteobacteria bacterium]